MDPYDRAIYKYRPRETLDNPAFSWYPMKGPIPRRPKVADFQHQLSCYSKTGLYPSSFIVSPEWISEDMHETLPFLGRKWKPWPWEFQGARYWPHGTLENKLDEERNIKALVTPRDIPQEFRPVEGQEKELINPTIRLHLLGNRTPWRPNTSMSGYVVNKEGGVFNDPSRPMSSGSRPNVQYSRHVGDLQYQKGTGGYEEYFDHESPYHSHHPDDIALTNTQNAANGPLNYANQTTFPLLPETPYGQRPRFERPYRNMANGMWIGTRYADSPGQN